MATNSLQSLHHHHHHHHHSLIRPHSLDTSTQPPSIHFSSLISFKPNTTTPSLSYTHSLSTTTFSLSTSASTTAIPSTSLIISFDLLQQHLISQNFRQADEETRRLLIALAGEAAKKRGYVFFSETKIISETDLIAIDNLWKKHSNNKFGYSVQKKIWEKANKDFTNFFIKVGWMKKLDTEVEQYNYRAFPNEFIWEMNDDTPMGHLPLTNALRGTQLLNSVLTHPAFDQEDDEREVEEREKVRLRDGSKPPLSYRVFKTDYSF